MAKPASTDGARAARLLRLLHAVEDLPEPNRAARRAAAKRARRKDPRS